MGSETEEEATMQESSMGKLEVPLSDGVAAAAFRNWERAVRARGGVGGGEREAFVAGIRYANLIVEEMLAEAPEVFGCNKGASAEVWCTTATAYGVPDTHRARLVNVERIDGK